MSADYTRYEHLLKQAAYENHVSDLTIKIDASTTEIFYQFLSMKYHIF